MKKIILVKRYNNLKSKQNLLSLFAPIKTVLINLFNIYFLKFVKNTYFFIKCFFICVLKGGVVL